jgi:hypothetical protein
MQREERMVFVIKTKDEIQQLLRAEGLLHPLRRPRVLIRMPGISHEEAQAWEQRLEELRQQCGCTSGAISLGLFVVLFTLHAVLDSPLATAGPCLSDLCLQAGIFAFGLILSALAGKFMGLLSSSLQFRRACHELMHRPSAIRVLMPNFPSSCCGGRR